MEETYSTKAFRESDEVKKIINILDEKAKSFVFNPYQGYLKLCESIFNAVKIKSKYPEYPKRVTEKYNWLIEFYKWKYLKEPGIYGFSYWADEIKQLAD